MTPNAATVLPRHPSSTGPSSTPYTSTDMRHQHRGGRPTSKFTSPLRSLGQRPIMTVTVSTLRQTFPADRLESSSKTRRHTLPQLCWCLVPNERHVLAVIRYNPASHLCSPSSSRYHHQQAPCGSRLVPQLHVTQCWAKPSSRRKTAGGSGKAPRHRLLLSLPFHSTRQSCRRQFLTSRVAIYFGRVTSHTHGNQSNTAA